MLRNYFKTALRSIIRQKTVSIINILCMAIAIGCSLIAYLFSFDNLHSEWFHENADRIFLVEHNVSDNGDLVTYGSSPTPLAPALLADHSMVKKAVRINEGPLTVHSGANQFEEWVRFTEPGFFDIFTFSLAKGDPKSLAQKDAVILSQEAARKYFGDGDPIGKTLLLEFSPGDKSLFTVTGVGARPIAPGSSLQFHVLLSYENSFRNNAANINRWNNLTNTFIEVDDPSSIALLTERMQPYLKLQNAADTTNNPIKSFVFQNLHDISVNRVNNSIGGEMSWAPIIVLSMIAIFLLLLACFNWINVNIGAVGARLKEIGIRKVIGGNKRQLIFQFLTENLLVCFASFLVAVALTGSLLLPAFEDIAGTGIRLDFSSRMDIWLYLLILFAAVSVCSGLYPALYIASFQPVAILRDRVQLGGKNKFTKTLLTIQFVLAFITIIASVGLTVNYYDMRQYDWGYAHENILTIPVANSAQLNALKKVAEEQPGVTDLTAAQNPVGFHNIYDIATLSNGIRTNAVKFNVAANYFSVMGFQTLSGTLPATSNVVAVNEKFARLYGGADAIGQTITIDSTQYAIAAVIKDFHHNNFMHDINPVVFAIGKEASFGNLVMRVEAGAAEQVRSALESSWKKNFPEATFIARWQDETFNHMYAESDGILRIFIFTTVVATLMSCIGLFGLAAQRLQAKRKEICIRKIFGVPLGRAVLIVNGNFLALIAVAAVAASPIAYFLLNELLDSIYVYRMNVGVGPFVISYVLMVVTVLVTLSEKIFQIARTNPAHVLRNE